MKTLTCANLNFLMAWLVIDSPLAWMPILAGFGCLASFGMLLAWDAYDLLKPARK